MHLQKRRRKPTSFRTISRLGAFSLVAASALLGFQVSSANAADLSGSCCADLEERIAELEATTARKGNRRMSLTVSGQVHQIALYFSDGFRRDIAFVDNTNTSTRFRFTGTGKVSDDVSIGYMIELEGDTGRSFDVDQLRSVRPSTLNIRKSEVWADSKRLGRLWFGLGSPATDDIILLATDGANAAVLSDTPLIGGGLFLRQTDGTLLNGALQNNTRVREFAPGLDTRRFDRFRYDSPTWLGGKLVASFGERSEWDVAVWWDGKLGDFTARAAIGYYNDNLPSTGLLTAGEGFQEVKGSSSIIHDPTGLFFTQAFVHRMFDGNRLSGGNLPDLNHYYARTGIVGSWFPIGKTTLYGEFANSEDGLTGRAEAGFAEVTSSRAQVFGIGILQNIPAAATDLYLSYRHWELDASGVDALGGARRNGSFEDVDLIYAGALVRF
ncbi:MAG: porin [Hyphomicrobiaceae bacterium]